MKNRYVFHLKAVTIQLKKPESDSSGKWKRIPVRQNETNDKLIDSESFLRREAYKNSPIQMDDSFFNDSDMVSDYYLVVVYDKKTGTPLLSSRYYFDKTTIAKMLKGENISENTNEDPANILNLDEFPNGKIFLADRLSGNLENELYKKHRKTIFALYYSEMLNNNKDCHLILMARSDQQEKLLTKYLRIGFHIIGSTVHKGKKHWIVLNDLKKSSSYFNKLILSSLALKLNRFRFKSHSAK